MNIKVINSFKDIANLNKQYDICFIDIEGTIFKNNIYYDLLDDHHYTKELMNLFYEYNKEIVEEGLNPMKNITSSIYVGKHYKREIIDNYVVDFIKKLQKRGVIVCALTSGYPSFAKDMKLKEQDIHIPILFTSNKDKGLILNDLIEQINYKLNKKVTTGSFCVIDNHFHKLLSIYNHNFEKDLDLIMCNFEPEEFKIKEFRKYWRGVFDSIVQGKYKYLLTEQKIFQKEYQIEQVLENLILDLS